MDKIVVHISHSIRSGGDKDEWDNTFESLLIKLFENHISNNVVFQSSNSIENPGDIENASAWIIIIDDKYFINKNSRTEFSYIKERIASQNCPEKLFLIRKTNSPIPNEKPLTEKYSYDFFFLDNKTGKLVNLSGDSNDENYSKYWYLLVDMAFELRDTLFESINKANINDTQTVYLAEPGIDQIVNNAIIRRELQHHGYRVVPEKPIPLTIKEATEEINNYLSQSIFSIHLVGNDNGPDIENSIMKVVNLQNKLAALHYDIVKNDNTKGSFQRLIWIQPNTIYEDERQHLFVERLRRDPDALAGAEIIQTPLEVFKQIVREKIILSQKNYIKSIELKANEINNSAFVYLISEKNQEENINVLKKEVEKYGFSGISLFDENHKNLIKSHREFLTHCEFSIIYYTNGNEAWLNSKLNDIIKSPGFGRTKPIKNNLIINKTETTISENILLKHKFANVTVIPELSENELSSFFKSLT